VDLAPGRYTLETAVMDQEGTKGSAKRVSLVVTVEPPAAVDMSSMALIRRIEPEPQGAPSLPLDTVIHSASTEERWYRRWTR